MSYRRWQTDGGDSESRACGEGGRAVSPAEEEEEVASPFPSSLETGGDPTPWRGDTEKAWVKHAFKPLDPLFNPFETVSIKRFTHCDIPIKAGATWRPANHMIRQTQRSS